MAHDFTTDGSEVDGSEETSAVEAPNFQHFLLTRFNVRMPWKEKHWGADPAWCLERLALFEKFALPSITNQVESGFKWLVFFDDTYTPAPVIEAVAKWTEKCPPLTPVFMDLFTGERLCDIIREHTAADTKVIVTTRLDTDDAMTPDFMQRIREYVLDHPHFHGFINCDLGYCYHGGKTYLYKDRANMFFSCVALCRGTDFDTAHHFNHSKISENGNVVHFADRPMFLLVNHDQNISARGVHGKWRVPKSRVIERLKIQLQGAEEALLQVYMDNAIYTIKRPLIPLVRLLRTHQDLQ